MASIATPFEKLSLRALTKFGSLLDQGTDVFDHELWIHAHTHQLGVIAWDPRGHNIGLNRQESFLKNYAPMDKYKQTLVGKMLDYTFYNDRGSGDEADWCILIDPSARYRYILDDVVQVMTSGEKDDLQEVNGKRVVECEITPDQEFYNNGHFTTTDHKSPNIGKTLGLYGPWVRDGGHGGRPEIHPCEIIWWRDTAADNLHKWTFLAVQDDSNRYDRKSNFRGEIVHPWSKPPRRAAFAVALELKIGFLNRYRLSVGRHRNMALLRTPIATINKADYVISASFTPRGQSPRPRPTPVAAPTLRLEVEKKIAKVRDLGPGDSPGAMQSSNRIIPPIPDVTSPGMLDASLSKIVADPGGNGAYRCFLTFQVQVGTTNHRGGEGYAEIFLQQLKPTPIGGLVTRR